MSAGEAGRHVVGSLDLKIDVFQEVQENIVKYCIYQTILLMGFIYGITYTYSRKSAENLFPYILA